MEETPKTHRRVIRSIAIAICVAGLASARNALALSVDNTGSSIGLATADLLSTVTNVINWVLGLLGLVAVSYIIYAGYQWLTAGGNEERVTKAKKILTNAVIGLVVILFAWAIVNFIINGDNNSNGGGGGGGGSDACTTGSDCADCIGGHYVYNGNKSTCNLPQDAFEVRSITTSCGNPGSSYRDDVFLCSSVSILFNQVVKTDNLQQLVESPVPGQAPLAVEQCSDANCTTVSQPTPLFSATPPAIAYSGAAPTGTKAEFVANGKSASFVHAHQLFAASTTYRLTIPLALTSASGKALTSTGCKQADGSPVPGCTFNAQRNAFEWIFHVGTSTDTTPPKPVSAYPQFLGAGYPDRDVSRAPIITMQFDEAIAPWTLTDQNIQIRPVTGANDQGEGGDVGQQVAGYDVQPVDDGFELSFVDGNQLEPFTWYEISTSGIRDLCLNAAEPKAWRFQTNGVGLGIAQVYPDDGYQYACVATEMFVQFNTSMYDPKTSSCAVLTAGGGYVMSGAQIPPRVFQAEDDKPPGQDVDPNAYCKKYSWLATTDQLNPDATYQPSVATRMVIDSNGTLLARSWSFTTKKAGECADAPYIREVSPPSGQAGRCLSVIGGNFQSAQGDNTLSFQKPDGTQQNITGTDIKNWSDAAVVTNAPDVGAATLPFSSPVSVSVDYGNPIGILTSAPNPAAQFTYNAAGDYTGPCLYSLDPTSGYRSDQFSYSGERFDPNSITKKVNFGGSAIVIGEWSDAAGNASVPSDAPYGQSDVSVENAQGRSNALPMSVLKVPPGAFQVNSVAPSCGGNVSCTNTAIYAAMSQSIAPPPAGSVELRLCANEQCTALDPNAVSAQASIDGAVNRVVITPASPLARSTWYRAILHGGESGVKSTAGATLVSLNFDSNADSTNDAYSWTFGTAADADVCAAATVQCRPESASIAEGGTRQLSSHPFSAPNACDNAGTELDGTKTAWAWSSADPAYVTVSPDSTAIGDQPITMATGVKATPLGQTVAVTTTGDGKSAQCRLSVSNLSCETDSDCVANAKNPDMGQCTGSVCAPDTHLCTPVVKSISPTQGASGSWITVRGCYFGSYVDGSSKVLFEQKDKPELNGLWPGEAFCGPAGSTWKDDQIVVQVPSEDLTTASTLRVQRSDAKTADSPTQFDPTGIKGPGLCSVTPANGQAGKTIGVTLKGADLGIGAGANDAVRFYRNINVPASATAWSADGTAIGDVAVPSNAENNMADDYNEVAVAVGSTVSNGLNFALTSASCVACTDADSTMCNAKQACGTVGGSRCCADKPIVAAYAPKNPPATCANASISASFVDNAGQPLAMDASTISASTITLAEKNTSTAVALSGFLFPTAGTFIANPTELLTPNTAYRVTIAKTVQSAAKVALGTDFGWDFTTKVSGDPCPVDAVVVAPPSFLFTDLGEQQTATAQAYDTTGQLIHPVESYSWTWEWAMDDSGVASVPADVATEQVVATAVKNGTTSIRATANISDGKKKSGLAPVTVNACKNPWNWQGDGVVERPYSPYSNNAMHLSTWYCKDGSTALPDLTPIDAGSTDELLWEFFFENPKQNEQTRVKDAVGLRVYKNPDHLSPSSWVKQFFGKDMGTATSQVNGYEAMRIGTSMYIAGTNLDASHVLYTNIYVLAYNEGAGSDVVDIYNQMLANFTLNTNSSDFAYDDVDSAAALQRLRRDTKRMADLASLQSTLASYDTASGAFPQFSSGSYIANMSTSVWPSWQQTLASALQQKVPGAAVPADPKNDLAPICTSGDKCTDNKCASGSKIGQACTADGDCNPYEPTTCWAEPLKLFQCPADSHIYTYDVTNAGENYDLYAHLEYRGAGSYVTGTPSSCGFLNNGSNRTDCACYTYQQFGISTGTTGYNDTTRPSTPTKPAIDSFTADSVTFHWAAANDYGGSGIQWYDVWRSVDGATYVNAARLNGQVTAYTDVGLASATTYYYKVSAHDNAGNDSFRSDPAIQLTGS